MDWDWYWDWYWYESLFKTVMTLTVYNLNLLSLT